MNEQCDLNVFKENKLYNIENIEDVRKPRLFPSIGPDMASIVDPNKRLVIGDLHGNFLKLLHLLYGHGLIDTLHYKELADLYEKSELSKEDLKEFRRLVKQIKIKRKDVLLTLIGDELADRGKNDYFTWYFLRFLAKKGLPYEVIPSNHSIEALLSIEQKNPELTSIMKKDQARSIHNLQNLISEGLVKREDIDWIYHRHYKTRLKLLPYSLISETNAEDTIAIFSHAPIGIEEIKTLAIRFNIPYLDGTPKQLATTLDRINTIFSFYVEKNKVHTLFTPDELSKFRKNLKEAEDPVDIIFNILLWNRDYKNLNREPGKDYKILFYHGHDKKEKKPPENVASLDNSCCKSKGSIGGTHSYVVAPYQAPQAQDMKDFCRESELLQQVRNVLKSEGCTEDDIPSKLYSHNIILQKTIYSLHQMKGINFDKKQWRKILKDHRLQQSIIALCQIGGGQVNGMEDGWKKLLNDIPLQQALLALKQSQIKLSEKGWYVLTENECLPKLMVYLKKCKFKDFKDFWKELVEVAQGDLNALKAVKKIRVSDLNDKMSILNLPPVLQETILTSKSEFDKNQMVDMIIQIIESSRSYQDKKIINAFNRESKQEVLLEKTIKVKPILPPKVFYEDKLLLQTRDYLIEEPIKRELKSSLKETIIQENFFDKNFSLNSSFGNRSLTKGKNILPAEIKRKETKEKIVDLVENDEEETIDPLIEDKNDDRKKLFPNPKVGKQEMKQNLSPNSSENPLKEENKVNERKNTKQNDFKKEDIDKRIFSCVLYLQHLSKEYHNLLKEKANKNTLENVSYEACLTNLNDKKLKQGVKEELTLIVNKYHGMCRIKDTLEEIQKTTFCDENRNQALMSLKKEVRGGRFFEPLRKHRNPTFESKKVQFLMYLTAPGLFFNLIRALLSKWETGNWNLHLPKSQRIAEQITDSDSCFLNKM